ncbi:MAG TPA: ABC transporter permease [Gemmatimonadaceae bacterium]|nr:ABC transporter permease [Gemmatimonadaceae bacterium]
MSVFSHLRERARALFGRDRMEHDLDDEMRFHIERDVEERVRQGTDPVTARRAAVMAVGGVEQQKERVRDARGVGVLENLGADLRFALRALRRDPIFSVAAALVLALGIGAASAVYGIADAVLFASLPYPEPDRIVRVYQKYSNDNMFGLSMVDVMAIAEQQHSFSAFGVMRPGSGSVSAANATPEQRGIGRATSGFFTVLGVTPAAGRLLQPSDETPGAPQVMVLTHAQAVRWFGAPERAVGQAVQVDAVPYTVVGVLPPNVTNLAGWSPAMWAAMPLTPPQRRGPFGIRAFGRLKDGVTMESATRDLGSISERIFPIWKSSFRDSTSRLTPVDLRQAILGAESPRQVGLLAAGVFLVLLVAVANVAMLMLVRISAREPELAVRTALGASRWRLGRLLAGESIVLGAVAAVLGFALAVLILRLAPSFMPTLPRISNVSANARVAVAAAGAGLVSAVVAMISPMLSVLGRPVTSIVADRRVGAGKRTDRMRSVLVATEFGLALPLLFGAGLLFNSFVRLQRVNPGFNPDGTVAVSIGLPLARYQDPAAGLRFWRELESRVRSAAAFSTAGVSSNLPPTDAQDINNFDLKDKPVPPGGNEHLPPWMGASNGYFEALAIPLIEGRLFTPSDTGGNFPVAIVSQSWAKKYYPEGGAVGKQFISGGCTTCPLMTVIGVVGDVKYMGLGSSSDAVYEPLTQYLPSSANLVARVRGSTPSAGSFKALREIVGSMDPQIALVETTLRDEVDRSLDDPRRFATILGSFAFTTVLLASVGIFGLMAYTVRTRRREIGVRMALGAQPGSVVGMIVARGMRYAIAGSVIGIGIALLGGRWLRGFLFGVGSTDPATLALVTITLLTAATLACWFAARRAARIHPVEAIAGN